MGRYYFGTISGKFWGNIQESEDASKFKSRIIFSGPLRCNEYIKCKCFVNNESLYCSNCYESKEAHIADLDEYELDELDANEGLIYESNCIKYYFEKNELEYVQKKLKELQNKIGEHIIEGLNINLFEIGERDEPNYRVCFDYTINEPLLDNMTDDVFGLTATWCFGKQIEKSIQELGYCEIYCEA